MKKVSWRKLALQVAGFGAGGLAVMGYFPVGLAWFSAVYLENAYRALIFPAVLIGIATQGTLLQVAKYGLCMVIVVVLTNLLENGGERVGKWAVGFFAGAGIAAMEFTDYLLMVRPVGDLIRGICEGVLVFSLTVIFDIMIGKFLYFSFRKKEENVEEYNPVREKMKGLAESFQNLASTVSQMPSYQETLSEQDVGRMFDEIADRICQNCERKQKCWKNDFLDTYKLTYEIFTDIEQNGERLSPGIEQQFSHRCIHSKRFLKETVDIFKRARQNLLWNNKLMENREAVAAQLSEVAQIMVTVADDMKEGEQQNEDLEDMIRKKLRSMRVSVSSVSMLENREKRQEVYLTMKEQRGKCISTKEIANALSKVIKKPMVPARDSRNFVGQEYGTTQFVEDTNFKVLYGVARSTREDEKISGDNFAFTQTENGQLVVSLSDGMGSGIPACQESEQVIELLEQFLEAGFCKETAIKLINSALVIRTDAQTFSTVDISAFDLYSGVCEFLKVGASTTFIKRDHWVEAITSTSLPMGVFHQLDFDSTNKKLYDGDFVIMVTDGVLDALPIEEQDTLIREIIMEADTNNPKELSRRILERAKEYNDNKARDDMTVLAIGIWKK
ncbi:SpoIIE family protein phosphatase [Diplocloster hominis]|uniref:SpoIIE family protein phosphatase n=1 Tax=Diplocloster hominis TaxID=3079010 RepID=UPI0031BA501F